MDASKLAKLIEAHFDMAEIDGLVFDLGLPGSSKLGMHGLLSGKL